MPQEVEAGCDQVGECIGCAFGVGCVETGGLKNSMGHVWEILRLSYFSVHGINEGAGESNKSEDSANSAWSNPLTRPAIYFLFSLAVLGIEPGASHALSTLLLSCTPAPGV
jgi:hypothetical protein